MKVHILLIFLFLLVGCNQKDYESLYQEELNRQSELNDQLQTLEVAYDRNQLHLEALNRDIKVLQSDVPQDNYEYVDILESYSKNMNEDLSKLNSEIKDEAESRLAEHSKSVKNIIEDIDTTINTYSDEVEQLELNEVLQRQHESLQIVNNDLMNILERLQHSIDSNDGEGLEESINAINEMYKEL